MSEVPPPTELYLNNPLHYTTHSRHPTEVTTNINDTTPEGPLVGIQPHWPLPEGPQCDGRER
eukprot:15462812-Alexandrium_andersonii.AAC.1